MSNEFTITKAIWSLIGPMVFSSDQQLLARSSVPFLIPVANRVPWPLQESWPRSMPSKASSAAYDVFIVGAGPAGAAVAISLSQVIPSLRVCLADAGKNIPFRIGESVPPTIKPFLDHLGVSSSFEQTGHSPSFRTLSAWGGPELISNEFFLHVYHTGWRLDRQCFDRMLITEAVHCGTEILSARVCSLKKDENGWLIDCGTAGRFSARYVVDASGRDAICSRLLKRVPIKFDRLVACSIFFEQRAPSEAFSTDAAVIEAFRNGWWYTAAIPGNRRVAMLMTDIDIARQLQVAQLSTWLQYLAETQYIRPLVATGCPLSPPLIWPASSRYFACAYPPNMLAVGDAISSFDPLSSQGIIKALRSSLFASYAIADHYLRDDESGSAKYHALMNREFDTYLATRREYYQQEQRWPDAPFWQRRHQIYK
ncbi:tryptophan 7-halogenase [Nitrosomonas communis]|nr:tryptophan 7-halogenase [Nitrosomonas communis]